MGGEKREIRNHIPRDYSTSAAILSTELIFIQKGSLVHKVI